MIKTVPNVKSPSLFEFLSIITIQIYKIYNFLATCQPPTGSIYARLQRYRLEAGWLAGGGVDQCVDNDDEKAENGAASIDAG